MITYKKYRAFRKNPQRALEDGIISLAEHQALSTMIRVPGASEKGHIQEANAMLQMMRDNLFGMGEGE